MPVYNPLLRPQPLKPSAAATLAIHRGRAKNTHRRVGFRSSKHMRLLTLLIVGLLLSGTVIEQAEAWRFFRRIGRFFKRAATRVFNVVTRIPVIGGKIKAVVNVVRSVARGDIKGALIGAATNFGPLAKIRSLANVVSKIPGVGSRLGSVTGALNSISRLDFKGGLRHAKGIGGDLKNVARAKIAVLRPIGGIVKSVARGNLRGAIGGVKQMATGMIGNFMPPPPPPEVEEPEPPEPVQAPAPAASVEEAPPAGETAQEQAAPAPAPVTARRQQPVVARRPQAVAPVQQQPAPAMSSYPQQPAFGAYSTPAAAPVASPYNTQQAVQYGSSAVQNMPGAMPVPFYGGQQQQPMPFNNFAQQQQQQQAVFVNQFGQLVPQRAFPQAQHGQQQLPFASMMANGFAFQPNPNVYGPSTFSYPTTGASPVPIVPGQCYCPCASMAAARAVAPPSPAPCGCGAPANSPQWTTPHDEDEYFAGNQEYIDEISVADGGRIPMGVLQVIREIQAGRIGQYVKENVSADGGRRWQPKQRTRIVRRVRIGRNGAGIAGRAGRRRQY